jgi:hypothetical protein
MEELWTSLGISNIIEEVIIIDCSGSTILEYFFRDQDRELPGFESIGQKETICVACWYLMFICCRCTHGEMVLPIFSCKMYILSITANGSKVGSKLIPR